MSADAISPVTLLAGSRGLSIDQLTSRVRNSGNSVGVNIAQVVSAQRQTIEKATIESLLTDQQRTRLEELRGQRAQSDDTSSALKDFLSRIKDVESRARSILSAGPAGAFEGRTLSVTGNTSAIGVTSSAGAQAGTFVIDITKLANGSDNAVLTVNGQQFTSASNTFTGISGLSIDLKKLTTETVAPTFGSAIDIKSFNASKDELKLDDNADLAVGDVIQFQGLNGQIAGLTNDTNFTVKSIDTGSGKKITLQDSSGNTLNIGADENGSTNVSGVTLKKVISQGSSTTNTVTVKVSQDPESARKAIIGLAEAATEAVNVLETNPALSRNLTASRIGASVRQAFLGLLSTAGDAITTSGTSNAINVDSGKLLTKLQDSATFTQIEQAIRRPGGVAFGLINATSSAGDSLGASINALAREQQSAESGIARLTAQAEEKRNSLLQGLQSITQAALASRSSRASIQGFLNNLGN